MAVLQCMDFSRWQQGILERLNRHEELRLNDSKLYCWSDGQAVDTADLMDLIENHMVVSRSGFVSLTPCGKSILGRN
jgi:hypothetical protein